MKKHYVIGTHYEKGTEDLYQYMLKHSAICIGHGYTEPSLLKRFYGKPDKLVEYLKISSTIKRSSIHKLKLFVSLKEGDIIAIKKDGMPRPGKQNNLILYGYARVENKNGKIFDFDEEMSHMIYVKHLERNLNKDIKFLEHAYPHSMHDCEKHEEDIPLIFGKYA